MKITLHDLGLIGSSVLKAIVRDDLAELPPEKVRKKNNHRTKNRLWCFCHDNRIPEVPCRIETFESISEQA